MLVNSQIVADGEPHDRIECLQPPSVSAIAVGLEVDGHTVAIEDILAAVAKGNMTPPNDRLGFGLRHDLSFFNDCFDC